VFTGVFTGQNCNTSAHEQPIAGSIVAWKQHQPADSIRNDSPTSPDGGLMPSYDSSNKELGGPNSQQQRAKDEDGGRDLQPTNCD
jgi:hypothetical protein